MTDAFKVGFVGAGNMAQAIIGGLLDRGFVRENLMASAPSEAELEPVKSAFSIPTTTDNAVLAEQSDVLILAIKPQVMHLACESIASSLAHQPLILSIAAGISLSQLGSLLGEQLAIVRVMPNTPAQLQLGATGMVANDHVSEALRLRATQLFESVSLVEWFEDEDAMHAVTALSGSGPAYVFYVIESMEQAAQKLGMSAQTARTLAAQTVLGAAKMVLELGEEPGALKRKVMSPGGTTERGIAALEAGQLEAIFEQAITDAERRSRELGES